MEGIVRGLTVAAEGEVESKGPSSLTSESQRWPEGPWRESTITSHPGTLDQSKKIYAYGIRDV